MVIRLLVLAALVSSAFSAHADPISTSQLQTYMPRAVEGFFVFHAPAAPVTAPVVLADIGLSAAAPPPAASAGSAAQLAAALQVTAPAALQVTAPAALQVTAPATLQATSPVDTSLADFSSAGASAQLVAKTDIPVDVQAAFSAGATANAALAPSVLLPLAVDANAVPEPGSGGLMLAGLAGLGFMACRRRSR